MCLKLNLSNLSLYLIPTAQSALFCSNGVESQFAGRAVAPGEAHGGQTLSVLDIIYGIDGGNRPVSM